MPAGRQSGTRVAGSFNDFWVGVGNNLRQSLLSRDIRSSLAVLHPMHGKEAFMSRFRSRRKLTLIALMLLTVVGVPLLWSCSVVRKLKAGHVKDEAKL